ncbi:MAG: acetate--CoA ligase family protein, partial [Acidimicrobiia bacterium]|nr:acetate--CoA ligase family protein [Acidimicrobiia bacterium]
MDLFEYQGKSLFARMGVPVPQSAVARTPAEARSAAEQLGGRVVVKAQVQVGGRGKAGGIKLAADPDEAEARAGEILGMDIKGHTVHIVLIEEVSDIAAEWYV